ncbi:MAG: helix-turn-helix transcriptional regulator [Rhizobiaceae bacterium]
MGTALIPITPHDTISGLIVSPSLDEAAAEYRKDWWRIDTRVGRIHELRLSHGVFAEPQLFSEDELARDPIRQEFLASFGIGSFAAQLVEPWPGHVIAFSVQRALTKGHLERMDMETLNWLGRHAARALTISYRLAAKEALTGGLLDVLEKFDGGVFVLNRRGEVALMNATAEQLLGDGLTVGNRRLRASTAHAQRALDGLTNSAFNWIAVAGDPIALPRPSGKRALLAQSIPIRSRRLLNDPVARAVAEKGALLLVIDPDTERPSPQECLRLLGLTGAEARLAALVGSGARRREAAEALGISEWTARDALKHIYSKLGISSQGELVRLVDRIAAVEGRPRGETN